MTGRYSHPPGSTQNWRARAACLDVETEFFFKTEFEIKGLAVCDICPVIKECRKLADEFEAGEPLSRLAGIYGGLRPRERYERRKARNSV